ncbi:MAG: pyridoxal-phosphate dependent enzyme [Flavobacteriales bacterium]|nr:pyridoxal-phosphate dependent enzyme [Flavobacteriales bacterium]
MSPVQEVQDVALEGSGVRIVMKRDDLIHPVISGNKWRKLRYNLSEAVMQDHHTVLTFGGAFSNHIAATAHACHSAGLDSIGIIRGDELKDDELNVTLRQAKQSGMDLHFVSREAYRRKAEPDFLEELKALHGRFYAVPEGGANGLGVKGCAEILPEVDESYDVVCCAAGTGTTLAGLRLSLPEGKRFLGFPALKGGDFLMDDVERLVAESRLRTVSPSASLELINDYHFGGYAKMTPELWAFTQSFQQRTDIPLDPIYTSKMMFGIYDLIGRGHFSNGTVILAIHTGGLQGWLGMDERRRAAV